MSLVTSWERCLKSALRAYQKVSSICTMRAYSLVVVYSEERRKAKMLRKERARRKKRNSYQGNVQKKSEARSLASPLCGGGGGGVWGKQKNSFHIRNRTGEKTVHFQLSSFARHGTLLRRRADYCSSQEEFRKLLVLQ